MNYRTLASIGLQIWISGALAGKSALDMMEKACNEPNTDEKVPINMKAMLQLALDGSDT